MSDREFWAAIDHHYLDLVVEPDSRFQKILQNSREAGLPAISITSSHGSFFEILVRALGVRRILEIGTLGGFSTAWFLRGLPPDGEIISLEIDPVHAEIARKNLALFEDHPQVEIIVGDARQTMTELIEAGKGPFDLIFLDGVKSQYPDYLDQAIALSRSGTMIIADNVVKHGEVFNQEITTPNQAGVKAFHEKIASDPRLQGTVVQTVGEKGHDGYAFILVDLK